MTAPALYVREGSRFVLYDARAQHVPPIPVPQVVHDVVDEQRPNFTATPSYRCEHGHFSRPGGPGRGCRPCGGGAPVSTRRR